MNTLVLGLMRGDEGKGKITDYFAKKHDVVIRYAGSCNAGHTIYRGDKKIVLHQIPSGILHKKICIIGRGCLIDLKKLYNEINMLQECVNEGILQNYKTNENIMKYIKISFGATLIFKHHIEEDIKREDSGKGNGSTKCGIAPAYRDKYYRSATRIFDLRQVMKKGLSDKKMIQFEKEIGLSFAELQLLSPMFFDEEKYLNTNNYKMLFEGAQGTLLDINSPYYPNVSSSSVGVDGILVGTGLNYNMLINDFKAIGVVKAYMSSVGVGKFLTELNDENAKIIRDVGKEYGATTGRPRKVGWLDLPLIRYAIRTSGVNALCITRLDTLMEAFKDIGKFKVCDEYINLAKTRYEKVADIWNLDNYTPVYKEFPIWKECSMNDENFKSFITYFQSQVNVPIKYLSIGQNEDDIITL